ncbi:phage terminase small subunit [Nocardia sp. MW-W600-9]
MAGRRSGPPPKNPEDRARRNADPLTGADGWTEIDPTPNDGEVPEIPEWITVGAIGRAVYDELAALPQARLYGMGTWVQLWMTLPLIERYLSRPGSENYKAITSTLGAALRLTEDDLQRARVRIKPVIDDQADEDGTSDAPVVDFAEERRARLLKPA